jgi:hypothetical protein
MERDFIPSWETREMTHEVELLALIEELDSAISRDVDALSRANSKRASAHLWARIHRKTTARHELCDHLPGPPALL